MKFLDLKSAALIIFFWSYAAVAGFFPINRGMVNQVDYVTTSGGVTTQIATGNQVKVFEGSSNQTYKLPDATTLPIDWWYDALNNSTGTVTVTDNSNSTVASVGPGQIGKIFLKARASAAGTWKKNVNISSSDLTSFFAKTDFIASSAGAGDAGKPIKTNGSGQVDSSFLTAFTAGITQLTGDVTTSAGGGSQAATIAALAVTNAKIANSTIDLTAKVTGILPNANTTASASAGNSTIVARDGSGNFAAGTITASLTGNASTATALAANPTDCSASQFANAIAASGNLTCSQPAASDLSNGTTGSGAVVLASAPTMTNPVVGTQSPLDNSTKAASTAYVDAAVISDGPAKDACNFATTAALPAVVYANGSSGVGATLTGVALAAISTDGSSPTVGQRILVKDQVSTFQNGIYTVTQTGSGIAVFILTRATDYDQSSEAQAGSSTFIISGTVNGATVWDQNSASNPTMGTSAITFAQTAGPGSITGGTGITVTGSSVAITATGVGASNCTNCNLTYNAQGQITVAATGSSAADPISVLTKTGNYTVQSSDFSSSTKRLMVEMNCSSPCTLTFAAASNSGFEVDPINIGSASATLATAGSDTFGSTATASIVLPPGGDPQASGRFVANGATRWNGFGL